MKFCAKCKKTEKEFPPWQSGEVYEGLDSHHNPPEFISDYLNQEWSGEKFDLCRKCHRELHDEIIKIMHHHSTLLKPKKSEYWTWIAILPINRKPMIQEIIKFTREWINGD